MRLEGKVAIITGAASGQGQAAARLFCREGAKVVVADMDANGGQETVSEIKASGGEATFVEVDVSKMADLQRMVKAAIDTYGKLNVLYNNAGFAGIGGLEEITEEQWDRTLNVMSKGAFFATKFAVPEIKKAGGGSIIFTSSTAGITGSTSSPIYSAAKGGVAVMTKSMAILLAPHNIRVNAICPGPIDTPFMQKFIKQPFHQDENVQAQIMAKLIGSIPIGRMGRPEEVANVALFLASDESSFVTGVDLPVDGGYLAR